VINVLPLLYYLCDWPEGVPHVLKNRLPEALFALASNMVHNWQQQQPSASHSGPCRNDCPIDTATFPALYRARIHLRPLLCPTAMSVLER
jgi:hypothetical protein